MGSPSFQFKHFTIFHDKCAMKVGTDGVLLGAWANITDVKTILDIGTGSGLISHMLAQRCNANITAIDIDSDAIEQASYNAEISTWGNRINNIEISLADFSQQTRQKFDLIISNPPYFKNSLINPDKQRTLARHADKDFHNEIINLSNNLLSENGRLCLILPTIEGEECIHYATANDFHCTKKTHVHPKPQLPAKRLLLEFSRKSQPTELDQLTIETDRRHEYSTQFIRLLKDFYLKF